jgi:hypothetical protein
MDIKKLGQHVKLCRKNLSSKGVKCCAMCLFEEETVEQYSKLAKRFEQKRQFLKD